MCGLSDETACESGRGRTDPLRSLFVPFGTPAHCALDVLVCKARSDRVGMVWPEQLGTDTDDVTDFARRFFFSPQICQHLGDVVADPQHRLLPRASELFLSRQHETKFVQSSFVAPENVL